VRAGRFITDLSLAWLARRLRALGFDVVVLAGAPLHDLCAVARIERRVVLTLSTRVPPPCGMVERVCVPRADEAGAVRDIAARFEPASPPFERCLSCNAVLERPEVPPPARVAPPPSPRRVRHCPGCGRWFWRGSHVDRLREWLETAIGHAIDLVDA
jgi:uncharacterized protein with PIN domain